MCFNMKPNLVADEMFPEGAGPFMELDEVYIVFIKRDYNKFRLVLLQFSIFFVIVCRLNSNGAQRRVDRLDC